MVTALPKVLTSGENYDCNPWINTNEKTRDKNKLNNASVRPDMNQTMPIACIDLVALFIIEESSNVFQGFRNCAPNSGGMLLFP